jgi:N-acetylneuraminic acid mutarotase
MQRRRFLDGVALAAGAILLLWGAQIVAQPANDQPWEPLAPVPEMNGLAGACSSIIGNKIYVAFGHSGDDSSDSVQDTNRLRIYDIATNLWSFGPSAPPAAGRADAYLGAAKGGKLYCLGGRPNNETWSFDPANDTWEQKASFPDGARVGTTSATYGNSIFVFGGRSDDDPCQSKATTAIRRYDVDQNAWFSAGNMTLPRSDATVARVGGKIYLFGGCDGGTATGVFYDSVEIYDPRTATSSLLPGTVLPGGPRANLSLQGVLLPALTDVQGEFTSVYVDLACAGQARVITATDAAGNSANLTFNCP